MGVTGDKRQTFLDWAGEAIPYRVRLTRLEEDAETDDCMTCEIDPHGAGQWTVMGRGRTVGGAVRAATAAWNSFDQAE